MNDPLNDYLFSTRRTSGDDLKQAAMLVAGRFIEKRANMNEGIAEVARDRNLNTEQIQRVVESANQAVFSNLFTKEASKQIEFPVADVRVVQQLLNVGQTKQASRESLNELMDSARHTKTTRSLDKYLVEKTASFEPAFERSNFQRGWLEARDIARETAQESRGAQQLAKQAGVELVKRVRQTIDLDGTDTGSIQEAITGVSRNDSIAKVAMRLCFGADAPAELTKTASVRRVDTEHPIVQAYIAFEDAIATSAAKSQIAKEAQRELESATESNKHVEKVLGIYESANELKYEAPSKVKTAAPTGSIMQRLGKWTGLLKEVPEQASAAGHTEADFLRLARESLADESVNAKRAAGGVNTGFDIPAYMRDYKPGMKDLEDRAATIKALDPTVPGKPTYEATNFGKGAGRAAGALAIGIPAFAAVHGIAKGMDKGEELAHGRKAWNRIVQENPALANDVQAQRTFKTLLSVAPDVARNELMAGPWINQRVGKFSDLGLDPKSVREVADLQRAIGEARTSAGKVSGSLRSKLIGSGGLTG